MQVIHYGLLVLLALTIVASLKAVGIILVVAMLIAPGATAFLLTSRFERMLWIAVAIAVGSSIVGTIASFHLDAATGPMIVVVQALVFLAAFLRGRNRAMSQRRRAGKLGFSPSEPRRSSTIGLRRRSAGCAMLK